MAAVTDIRFVGYGVPDLEAERAFYRDKWRLAEAGEHSGLVYFAVEGSSEPCAVRLRAADTRRVDVIELAAAARADVDADLPRAAFAGGGRDLRPARCLEELQKGRRNKPGP